jgi:hypothetical protein
MNFQKKLEELRALPGGVKKAVFWSILIVLSSVLILLWYWHSARVLKNFDSGIFIKKLNVPASTGIDMDGIGGDMSNQLQEKIDDSFGTTSAGGLEGPGSSSGTTSTN